MREGQPQSKTSRIDRAPGAREASSLNSRLASLLRPRFLERRSFETPMKPTHLILLLAMNFCWAAVYSAYKVIGPGLPSGSIVTLRFGIAAACLLLAWPWLPGTAPRGRDLLTTCLLGLMLYVLGQRLQVYGNHLGS